VPARVLARCWSGTGVTALALECVCGGDSRWEASRLGIVFAEPISNAEADRAGQLLRKARLDPGRDIPEPELGAARETVERFRLRFLERQDQWAELVETTARDTGLRLADGEGPDELLELFRVAGEIYATNDTGRPAPRSLTSEFERLLPALRSILRSGPTDIEG
jgi:hypothetical protein